MNITPEKISQLEPNEIFVFGSNLDGNHAGGAARFAVMRFGAEMGNENGIQGQSYAIPTLAHAAFKTLDKLPLGEIKGYVDEFIAFANSHQNLFFYVTPIGCGIAGFTENEIAPLFKECLEMDNVALPQSFIDVLGYDNENNSTIQEQRKMKTIIRLTEEDLHGLIKECVSQVIAERKVNLGKMASTLGGQHYLGSRSKRYDKRHDRDEKSTSNKIDTFAAKHRNSKYRDVNDKMSDAYYDGYEGINLRIKKNRSKAEMEKAVGNRRKSKED